MASQHLNGKGSSWHDASTNLKRDWKKERKENFGGPVTKV